MSRSEGSFVPQVDKKPEHTGMVSRAIRYSLSGENFVGMGSGFIARAALKQLVGGPIVAPVIGTVSAVASGIAREAHRADKIDNFSDYLRYQRGEITYEKLMKEHEERARSRNATPIPKRIFEWVKSTATDALKATAQKVEDVTGIGKAVSVATTEIKTRIIHTKGYTDISNRLETLKHGVVATATKIIQSEAGGGLIRTLKQVDTKLKDVATGQSQRLSRLDKIDRPEGAQNEGLLWRGTIQHISNEIRIRRRNGETVDANIVRQLFGDNLNDKEVEKNITQLEKIATDAFIAHAVAAKGQKRGERDIQSDTFALAKDAMRIVKAYKGEGFESIHNSTRKRIAREAKGVVGRSVVVAGLKRAALAPITSYIGSEISAALKPYTDPILQPILRPVQEAVATEINRAASSASHIVAPLISMLSHDTHEPQIPLSHIPNVIENHTSIPTSITDISGVDSTPSTVSHVTGINATDPTSLAMEPEHTGSSHLASPARFVVAPKPPNIYEATYQLGPNAPSVSELLIKNKLMTLEEMTQPGSAKKFYDLVVAPNKDKLDQKTFELLQGELTKNSKDSFAAVYRRDRGIPITRSAWTSYEQAMSSSGVVISSQPANVKTPESLVVETKTPIENKAPEPTADTAVRVVEQPAPIVRSPQIPRPIERVPSFNTQTLVLDVKSTQHMAKTLVSLDEADSVIRIRGLSDTWKHSIEANSTINFAEVTALKNAVKNRGMTIEQVGDVLALITKKTGSIRDTGVLQALGLDSDKTMSEEQRLKVLVDFFDHDQNAKEKITEIIQANDLQHELRLSSHLSTRNLAKELGGSASAIDLRDRLESAGVPQPVVDQIVYEIDTKPLNVNRLAGTNDHMVLRSVWDGETLRDVALVPKSSTDMSAPDFRVFYDRKMLVGKLLNAGEQSVNYLMSRLDIDMNASVKNPGGEKFIDLFAKFLHATYQGEDPPPIMELYTLPGVDHGLIDEARRGNIDAIERLFKVLKQDKTGRGLRLINDFDPSKNKALPTEYIRRYDDYRMLLKGAYSKTDLVDKIARDPSLLNMKPIDDISVIENPSMSHIPAALTPDGLRSDFDAVLHGQQKIEDLFQHAYPDRIHIVDGETYVTGLGEISRPKETIPQDLVDMILKTEDKNRAPKDFLWYLYEGNILKKIKGAQASGGSDIYMQTIKLLIGDQNALPRVGDHSIDFGIRQQALYSDQKYLLYLYDMVRQGYTSNDLKNHVFDPNAYGVRIGNSPQGLPDISINSGKSFPLGMDLLPEDYRRNLCSQMEDYLMAQSLRASYPPEDIAQLYLTHVGFGSGVSGIHTAAEILFDKNVNDLTQPEQALLVGIISSPANYSPMYGRIDSDGDTNLDRAVRRATMIVKMLADNKTITDQQAQDLRQKVLNIRFAQRIYDFDNQVTASQGQVSFSNYLPKDLQGTDPSTWPKGSSPIYESIRNGKIPNLNQKYIKGLGWVVDISEDNSVAGLDMANEARHAAWSQAATTPFANQVNALVAPTIPKGNPISVDVTSYDGSKTIKKVLTPFEITTKIGNENLKTLVPSFEVVDSTQAGGLKRVPGLGILTVDSKGPTSLVDYSGGMLTGMVPAASTEKIFIATFLQHEFDRTGGQTGADILTTKLPNITGRYGLDVYASTVSNSGALNTYTLGRQSELTLSQALEISANVPFQAAMKNYLQTNPDGWQRFMAFKEAIGSMTYDETGRPIDTPQAYSALGGNGYSRMADIAGGYLKLATADRNFTDPNMLSAANKVMDFMRSQQRVADLYPGEKVLLNPTLPSGGKFIAKSGTYEDSRGVMSRIFIAVVDEPGREPYAIAAHTAGQSIILMKNGFEAHDTELDSQNSTVVTLAPIVRSIAEHNQSPRINGINAVKEVIVQQPISQPAPGSQVVKAPTPPPVQAATPQPQVAEVVPPSKPPTGTPAPKPSPETPVPSAVPGAGELPRPVIATQTPVIMYGGQQSNWSSANPISTSTPPLFTSKYVDMQKNVNVSAAEIVASLAKLKPGEKPILIGHSFGANVVMTAAYGQIINPYHKPKIIDGIAGLILEDPTPVGANFWDSLENLGKISDKDTPVLLILSQGRTIPQAFLDQHPKITVNYFPKLTHLQLPADAGVQSVISAWTANLKK